MNGPSVALMPIVVAVAMSASNMMAGPGVWSAAQHDEDWGKFCTASYTSAEGIGIGFHGSPGGEVAAYLDLRRDTYPDEIDTHWRVDGGASYRLHGGVSDYFGYPELEVRDGSLLTAIVRGATLTVSLTGTGPFRVPLSGSGAALKAFRACLHG